MVRSVGRGNRSADRARGLDLVTQWMVRGRWREPDVLLSLGLIVQKGKFSAGTLDLVRMLKKVDFLKGKSSMKRDARGRG